MKTTEINLIVSFTGKKFLINLKLVELLYNYIEEYSVDDVVSFSNPHFLYNIKPHHRYRQPQSRLKNDKARLLKKFDKKLRLQMFRV